MTTSNKRLRILAERTIRLLGVYKEEHAQIADLQPLLTPLAQAFMDAYDIQHNYNPARREQVAEGKAKAHELHKLIRAWSSTMQTLVPGFTEDSLVGTPSVPDELVNDAQRLIKLLNTHGDHLPSASILIARLTELSSAASVEWATAQRVLAEGARLGANVASAREAFYVPFLGFRTTLGRLLGVTHRDYQQLKLKTTRGKEDEAADKKADPNAATSEATSTPANDTKKTAA